MNSRDYVEIDYTNWRGERRRRLVRVIGFFWGKSAWHPEEQWLFLAHDVEKDEQREFAMAGLHSWKMIKGSADGVRAL